MSETVEQLSKELKESIWKIPLYKEKDEFEEEDKQLSSNHGKNIGGGRALESEEEREESELIDMTSIGVMDMLENFDRQKIDKKKLMNEARHF